MKNLKCVPDGFRYTIIYRPSDSKNSDHVQYRRLDFRNLKDKEFYGRKDIFILWTFGGWPSERSTGGSHVIQEERK